jgi:hypothetical protein
MPCVPAAMLKCDAEGCCRMPVVIPVINKHPMLPEGWTEDVPVIVTNPNAPQKQPKFFCPEHSQKVV